MKTIWWGSQDEMFESMERLRFIWMSHQSRKKWEDSEWGFCFSSGPPDGWVVVGMKKGSDEKEWSTVLKCLEIRQCGLYLLDTCHGLSRHVLKNKIMAFKNCFPDLSQYFLAHFCPQCICLSNCSHVYNLFYQSTLLEYRQEDLNQFLKKVFIIISVVFRRGHLKL